eukprot:TRINITY_DN36_c0_g1_i1.p1 TRINITY_DN36_c0_g1~~TRINITY_DN36_c0_g1_i1.p1  ORF type:complete len:138 (-),score=24.22 TRINITY_DN36_c0_g1_i1:815-1228(-)
MMEDESDRERHYKEQVEKAFIKRPPKPGDERYDEGGDNYMWHAYLQQRQQMEHQVAMSEARELQENIRLCYLKHSVNARENCRELIETYAQRTRWPDFTPPMGREGELGAVAKSWLNYVPEGMGPPEKTPSAYDDEE